ncbi:DUF4440 domain-containing protein [Spirosoma spitsbergense]|uniref:DUF4440 domain-containing protein n=1 Tax=Spirosoma spitsbergense TaxID=431554 RepID=UPI000370F2B0
MKKSFLAVVILIMVSTCLRAQSQGRSEKTKVNQAVTKLFDGIATVDTELMKQYATDNFLLLENGAVWNMDTLINKLTRPKGRSFSQINHLDFMETEVTGSTAWVAYNNAADITIDGKTTTIKWLESAFLVRQGKDWKIRLLHSTVLKPKAQ